MVEVAHQSGKGRQKRLGLLKGRGLPLGLVVALVLQILALVVLVSTWWPPEPSPEDLNGLAARYEVVDLGEIQCGSGATHECGWEFVIGHEGTQAELRSELDRLGIDVWKIQADGVDQSRVSLSWIVSDPGAVSTLAALGLVVGILVTSLVGLALLIRRLIRVLTGP